MAIEKNTILDTAKKIHPELEIYEHRNQLTLLIPKEKLVESCKTLKESPETKFNMLTDITAIDWLDRKSPRFEVVYFLYSNEFKQYIRIKCATAEAEAVPTVTGIWQSANWYERETYDMYGIKFEGHPNLRRFYMPEDYNHPDTGEPLYPLRKDFPIMGIPNSLPLPPYPERDGEISEK